MPSSILGQGGSGGFQQGWNPFGSTGAPANPIGGRSQAQMPSSYGQVQQPLTAQLPQSSSVGSTGNYAQQIQQLGSLGDLYQGGNMPGGATVSRTQAPAGVNPMDLLTPVMQGQSQLVGGRMVGGTPTYSAYAPTGYQKAAQSYMGNSDPKMIAGALNDYSLGLGPPTGGTGMDYATMGKWLNNSDVQKNLSYNFAPSQGYEDWQQQQNYSSLLGDLSSWTAAH